jgi:predicted CXXCH cytochrome family protein
MARAGELGGDQGFEHSLPSQPPRLWSFAEGRDIAQLQSAPRTDELEVCAPCHSRRAELGAESGGYHDRYRLELLDPVLYFDDGQIKDEVFVYGSFIQSKMHAAGVVCSDCHEPHSLALRAEGNALCTRCHRASTFDSEAHFFHRPGTQGSHCVDCHMPERTYMGVDDRADHRFGVPQPLVSEAVDSPDVCTSCHEDKTPKWAAKHIAAHVEPREQPAYVAVLAAARRQEPGAAGALIELAETEELPAIIRATALEELALLSSPKLPESLSKLSKDESALVRRAVASAARGMPSALRAPIARALLSDPVRVVRLAAVAALLGVDQQDWAEADRRAFAKALDEYRAFQEFTADRGEGLSDLAHLATLDGDVEQALSLLRQATEVDPTFTAAYVNQADVYRAMGRNADAEAVLRLGLTRAADRAAIEHALGLTLVRLQRHEEALGRLAAAHEQRPEVLRYGYVYAVALFDLGRKKESIAVLERMHEGAPGNEEILALLVNYLTQTQQSERAEPYAKKLRELAQTR